MTCDMTILIHINIVNAAMFTFFIVFFISAVVKNTNLSKQVFNIPKCKSDMFVNYDVGSYMRNNVLGSLKFTPSYYVD